METIGAEEEMRPEGEEISWDGQEKPLVPDYPIIPFIEGDGTGPDIWAATRPVLDSAVREAYKGKRRIVWLEVLAGEKARRIYGADKSLPEETLKAISRYGIAIKGPLTTPVGSGFRSLNVALRQKLDLYACVRPVKYLPGVPTPVLHPEDVDLVIFRENTEDVYAGLEWPAGSSTAMELVEKINAEAKNSGYEPLPLEVAIGIKPMSEYNTSRLVQRAIQYAIDRSRSSVTLVHKGNIMKFTEGAFRDWGYKVAAEKFPERTITENVFFERYHGLCPKGLIVIKDRIADAMFQQLLLRPGEYDVLATPNLNGDYLSDAAAAQVGGLGMAPGANIGDRCAVFEATHGTAPKYAGLDKVNPGSLILSGVEMLRFMGWNEAAELIVSSLIRTIAQATVTYDLARQMEGSREVRCSEFGAAIQSHIEGSSPAYP